MVSGDFPGTLLFNNTHISEVKQSTAAAPAAQQWNQGRKNKKRLQELFFSNLFPPDFSLCTLRGNPKKSSFSFSKNLCHSILRRWVLKLHRSQITHLNCIFLQWNDCGLSHWCLNKSHFLFPPPLFRSRSNRPLIIYNFFLGPTRIDSGLLGNLNPTQSGAEPLCVYGGSASRPIKSHRGGWERQPPVLFSRSQ